MSDAVSAGLEHGKKYCQQSITLDEMALHEAIRTTINEVVYKELLLEALLNGANEVDVAELKDDLIALMVADPPELMEYGDRFTRLLLA